MPNRRFFNRRPNMYSRINLWMHPYQTFFVAGVFLAAVDVGNDLMDRRRPTLPGAHVGPAPKTGEGSAHGIFRRAVPPNRQSLRGVRLGQGWAPSIHKI